MPLFACLVVRAAGASRGLPDGGPSSALAEFGHRGGFLLSGELAPFRAMLGLVRELGNDNPVRISFRSALSHGFGGR